MLLLGILTEFKKLGNSYMYGLFFPVFKKRNQTCHQFNSNTQGKMPLNYQMKHVKSMNIVSGIFIKINLFSLGLYWILVLFGNVEFMSVVKYGNKCHIAVARAARQLERKQNAVICSFEESSRPGSLSPLCSENTPAFPLLRGSASATNELDDLGKAAPVPWASVSPSAK